MTVSVACFVSRFRLVTAAIALARGQSRRKQGRESVPVDFAGEVAELGDALGVGVVLVD